MSHVPTARTVVKFSTAVDATTRERLLSALARYQLATTVGFDLGERAPLPDRFPLRAVLTLLDGTTAGAQKVAEAATAARTWLSERADFGFVELEDKASGVTIRIRGRDPENAIRALVDLIPGLSAVGPIGWRVDGWAVEVEADEDAQTAPARFGGSQRPRVLVVETDWFSARGGISSFNRHLTAAMARAGADVVCVVLHPTETEIKHAQVCGVRLVGAPDVPGTDARAALLRRPLLDPGWEPDIVIGHGHVTGSYARVLCKDHFRSAARGHIVHTWSDHIEWQRNGRPDAGETAERRWTQDIDLARTAQQAFAVGPLLHGELAKAMSRAEDRPPVRIDPGFDLEDPSVRTPPAWRQKTVMVTGRLDDWPVKGLDIAAKVVGAATRQLRPILDLELLLRGVPPDEYGAIREQVLDWAGVANLQVTPRGYTVSTQDLRDDLRRSSLVLMPARAEGFGLVGLEAIVAGTPVLVSARSGLGLLLQEKIPGDAAHLVLPVESDPMDLERWISYAIGMLRDDAGAFAAAERVRKAMADQVTSSAAALAVLEAFSR